MNTRIILPLIFCFFTFHFSLAKDIFVSPKGNDSNNGSKEAPFLTIDRARLAVQDELKIGLTENMYVNLMAGTYTLDEAVVFGLDDSPSGNFTVTYQAFNSDEVIITGAKPVLNWTKSESVERNACKKRGECLGSRHARGN